jgi:glycosyltransferase involved in cell wall biosynthesis
MSNPIVSVILPVYNRPGHLRSAIDSVFAQTFADWELVIADDGSNDAATLVILSRLTDSRVKVLHLPRSGSPSISRNQALRAAVGEYVAFLDSDDLWVPNKLSLQLEALSARPECGWSYTAYSQIDKEGQPMISKGIQKWIPYDEAMTDRLLRIEALISTPSVMMRRNLAESLGGFDAELRYCEDYDLWIRAAERTPVVLLDLPLVQIRVHTDNYSSDRLGVHRSWVQLYQKHENGLADVASRRIASRRKAVSALTVASMLAAKPNGRPEAIRLLSTNFAGVLAQPDQWSRLVRLIAKLLLRK